jgi:hypothetical protein
MRQWLLIGAGGTALVLVALLLASDFNLAQVTLATARAPACELEFVEYISSTWEQQWAQHADEWSATDEKLCSVINEESSRAHIAAWVKGAALSQQGCGPFEPYFAEHNDTFSAFVYRDTCTGESTHRWIEPLAILTRHPEAFCLGKNTLINRDYLTFGLASDECKAVADSAHLRPLARRMRPGFADHGRLLLFDLGASYYASGEGGASQVNEYEHYTCTFSV